MADVAASGGNTVIIYARHQEIMDEINANHRNPRILSQFKLHDNITATLDVNEALKGADIVLGCLPSQITPDFLKSIKDIYPMDVPWVSCSKGFRSSLPKPSNTCIKIRYESKGGEVPQ